MNNISNDSTTILLLPVIILAVMGIVNLVFPRLTWFLTEGWKYKGGREPSSLWILFSRVGGLALILAALWIGYSIHDKAGSDKLADKISSIFQKVSPK